MFEKRGIPFVLLDLTCLVLGKPSTPFSPTFTVGKKTSRFVDCYNPPVDINPPQSRVGRGERSLQLLFNLIHSF